MFTEYRELLSRLMNEDAHFARLFEQHRRMDHHIRNMEAGITPAHWLVIEASKKEKLQIKDNLYAMLRKAATT
ncbi:YdcH family protein [Paraburkholderia adhaesiva]|uniref:YdcH family protein n=1 Tax=Paraburkholderia adhaesiva TaxID=2883244 RepID=UPI001F3BCE8F|nr:YdcH family protein [Paraburkholderia adhaesiva]